MKKYQYKTADGSVWEESEHEQGHFIRIDSPDGSYESDFRAQALNEILSRWGALSIYDPIDEQAKILTQVLDSGTVSWFGCKSYIERDNGPKKIIRVLARLGYEIRKKDTDG